MMIFILSVMIGISFSDVSNAATKKKTKIVYPPLFNTKEKRSRNFKPFKKWTGAIKRYSSEQRSIKPGKCKEKSFNKCHFDRWQTFLKTLDGKDKMTQVKEVNRFMNKARYITDPSNWGEKDYWATPGQFMAKFGDCEDYAIAKYMSLKQLGFKTSQMRVVAVKDLNLRVGHAILAVYIDGKAYILDNQIKKVAKANIIKHYVPVFSINQKYWWRHKKG
ncbi:MAG: transglutaminase-like cysteine peptidase [Rhodospirillales bacterium]|nr:transglutaminase-like cysteine peptidase [Rhodospirillales bacterium]